MPVAGPGCFFSPSVTMMISNRLAQDLPKHFQFSETAPVSQLEIRPRPAHLQKNILTTTAYRKNPAENNSCQTSLGTIDLSHLHQEKFFCNLQNCHKERTRVQNQLLTFSGWKHSCLVHLVAVTNISTEFRTASNTHEVLNNNNKTSMRLEKTPSKPLLLPKDHSLNCSSRWASITCFEPDILV